MIQNSTFADLGLGPKILSILSTLGYEEPTPIQRSAIVPLLEGRDVLGQAATGTGKTAAFALPMIQALGNRRKNKSPLGIVLVPTRELAMQVAEAFHRYGKSANVRVLPIYGGQPIFRQLRALESGVDIVVATPGRALDHLRRKTLSLNELRTVVLDEADEMLDMGFAEDIESILQQAPDERQTVLFSATLPPRIRSISKKHLRDPLLIEIAKKPVAAGEVPKVRQVAYVVPRPHKQAALIRVLDNEAPSAALVFCRTRTQVDELGDVLAARGFRSAVLHGGMSQEQRDKVMRKLHAGKTDIMVATDVAARGLDIERLTHVINFAAPSAPEPYVHRIGRVGRAGREGVAITLVEPREHRLLKAIERLTRRKIAIEKLPTVADLRSRRLEMTRAALREMLVENDYEDVRVVLESLADEFDPFEVSLAAVKLAHQALASPPEEVEIPEPPPRKQRAVRGKAVDKAGAKGLARVDGVTRKTHRKGRPSARMSRLFVSAGREAGVRPQDLVGAITSETGISGREIGAIEISDRFSFVEVTEELAGDVMSAMGRTRLKGRKITIRLANPDGEERPSRKKKGKPQRKQ